MKINKIIPLNRVEGDLEIHLQIDDGRVTEAHSVGTMYRGFENLLIGRAPLDSLVVTPRICGICSTAHLLAAASALDMAYHAVVPGNAWRIRNATLMVEQLQNDIRQSYLLFMPDLAHPAYAQNPLFDEAVQRYEPLKGQTALQAISETKKILEIIAILGGQWPHSSFMVPGGVVCVTSGNDINQCRSLLAKFRRWYEKRILGCSIERWQTVRAKKDLDVWLEERDDHWESDLGFFIRFARSAGLDKIGKGCGNFISFGSLKIPEGSKVASLVPGDTFFPAGFFRGRTADPFDQEKITEDITASFLTGLSDYKAPRHPFDGFTVAVGPEHASGKYSWAKAPRYDGFPAETGPLAELLVASQPLVSDLYTREGPNVFLRQLARIIRPALIIPALDSWLSEIAVSGENFFQNFRPVETGMGYGLTEAHRGALGHWMKIEDDKIAHYQIISPTTWNASPRDAAGRRGPWEEALVGTPIQENDDMVAVGHVVRSFDPCLVCTVHAIDLDTKVTSITIS
jgi:Ni,Fe-hydrogenase I large subunit